MTETILQVLNNIPTSEWAKMWCSFNRWEFPETLNHIKPDWWDTEHGHNTEMGNRKFDFLRPIMEHIEKVIGQKACNREWNRDRMTDEQHEEFWKAKSKGIII